MSLKWKPIAEFPTDDPDSSTVIVTTRYGHVTAAQYHDGVFKYGYEPGWYQVGSSFGECDSPYTIEVIAYMEMPAPYKAPYKAPEQVVINPNGGVRNGSMEACCNKEDRNNNGGCNSCGDPCF